MFEITDTQSEYSSIILFIRHNLKASFRDVLINLLTVTYKSLPMMCI